MGRQTCLAIKDSQVNKPDCNLRPHYQASCPVKKCNSRRRFWIVADEYLTAHVREHRSRWGDLSKTTG